MAPHPHRDPTPPERSAPGTPSPDPGGGRSALAPSACPATDDARARAHHRPPRRLRCGAAARRPALRSARDASRTHRLASLASPGQSQPEPNPLAYRSGGMNVRELLAARSGESLDTYAHPINPHFVKILRTIGFDRQWERTSGQYLYDAAGDRYLDLLGGFGMFNVGRKNPRVREALVEAMELEVPNAIQLGVSPLPGLLAEALLGRAPTGIRKVLFTSSGTEAVEAAIKLGRAAAGRPRVVS